MTRQRLAVFLTACTVVLAAGAASAADPCEEVGPDCRPMSAAEVKAFRERVAALAAALPVPDPSRYVRSSLGDLVEGMAQAAKGALAPGLPETMVCRSWAAGCFPTEQTDLNLSYSRTQDKKKTEKKGAGLAEMAAGFSDEMAGGVQVGATLYPHPYLLSADTDGCVDAPPPDARAVEQNPSLLIYEGGDEESAALTAIFGKRTCREEETLNLEKPAKNFAPVVSVELQISGPAAEVAGLRKKLDRRAFQALLGPMPK